MPAAEVMLDSNVVVYALSDAPPERKKRNIAAALLAEQGFPAGRRKLHAGRRRCESRSAA